MTFRLPIRLQELLQAPLCFLRRMPPLVLIKRDWFRWLFSRFAVETVHNCDCFSEVWSQFHRCISAWFVQWDIPVFLISLVLLRSWAIGVVLLCQLVHLDAVLLGPANFELRITKNLVSKKTIVNSIKILFDTSSRVREHGCFLLVSQLHVAIQTLWSQCLFPRVVWTKPMDCSLSTGLTVFTLVLCAVKQDTFVDFLSTRTGWSLCRNRSPSSNNWIFGFWLGLLGVFTTSSNFWTQFLHPIISQGNLRRRSRWRIYFLVYDFSSFPSW